MHVRPVAGLKVRDPVTRAFLPAEGTEVPDHDPYWLQLLNLGDVERVAAPAAQPTIEPPHAEPAAQSAHAE